MGPSLVLCSASPRRRDLLRDLGFVFEIEAPHVDESRAPGESPEQLARRLAVAKATAGMAQVQRRPRAGIVTLAADTVVAVGDEDLGKPLDRADAARMLRTLSGRVHRVITGVCVAGPSSDAGEPALRTVAVTTHVRFVPLGEEQVRWLADSGDGDDKAGAYAVQGLAGAFIDRLEGSFTNVVGLPLTETVKLLAEAGMELPWAASAPRRGAPRSGP